MKNVILIAALTIIGSLSQAQQVNGCSATLILENAGVVAELTTPSSATEILLPQDCVDVYFSGSSIEVMGQIVPTRLKLVVANSLIGPTLVKLAQHNLSKSVISFNSIGLQTEILVQRKN